MGHDTAEREEKRSYRRYAIWFPVTLVVGGHEIWAICRDASAAGFLLASALPVEVGAHVKARFRVRPDTDAEHVVEAKAVRQEASVGELMLAFPYRVALEFSTPVPELLADLERYSERAL